MQLVGQHFILLGQMKRNSINNCGFCKFITSVTAGHRGN